MVCRTTPRSAIAAAAEFLFFTVYWVRILQLCRTRQATMNGCQRRDLMQLDVTNYQTSCTETHRRSYYTVSQKGSHYRLLAVTSPWQRDTMATVTTTMNMQTYTSDIAQTSQADGHFGSFRWLDDTDDHGKWCATYDCSFVSSSNHGSYLARCSRYWRRKPNLFSTSFWSLLVAIQPGDRLVRLPA